MTILLDQKQLKWKRQDEWSVRKMEDMSPWALDVQSQAALRVWSALLDHASNAMRWCDRTSLTFDVWRLRGGRAARNDFGGSVPSLFQLGERRLLYCTPHWTAWPKAYEQAQNSKSWPGTSGDGNHWAVVRTGDIGWTMLGGVVGQETSIAFRLPRLLRRLALLWFLCNQGPWDYQDM